MRVTGRERVRWGLAAVALACAAAAAGVSSKRIDRFKAPESVDRLRIEWTDPAEVAGGKEFYRPLLLYVTGVPSKASAAIEKEVFGSAAIALATHLCRPVKITPDQAVDLPYLRVLPQIRDPMLIVVGHDGKIVGTLAGKPKPTARRCFQLMAQAVASAYERPLAFYVDAYLGILDETERLWRDEQKLAREEKKADAEDAEELARRRANLVSARQNLGIQETMLRAEMRLKAGEDVEAGADVQLTGPEREALDAYRNQARGASGAEKAFRLDALHGADSPAIVRAILREVRRGDSWTVWQASKLLAELRSPASLEVLRGVLLKGHRRERAAALLAFAARDADGKVASAAVASGRAGDPLLRQAAVRAMAAQKDDLTRAALSAALDDGAPGVRALAARGLARRGDARDVPALAARLKDPDWCVRRAALEALGRLRVKEAVPPLLAYFRSDPGLLHEVCQDALVETTARTYHYDLGGWRAWWKEAQESFEPATPEQVRLARIEVASLVRGDAFRWPREYCSIGTFSRRVVFLVDVGPSMAKKMELPPGTPAEKRAELWRGDKLDVAKAAVAASLERLDRDDRFNVIAFAGGVEPWRTKLARGSHRKAAIGFLKKLKVIQPSRASAQTVKRGTDLKGTVTPQSARGLVAPPGEEHQRNVYAALLAGLGCFSAEPLADRSRPEADTIILIVDGQPSLGAVRRIDRLTELVTELNRTRGVVIHVVTFAEQVRYLYEKLAVATGGQDVVYGR